MDVRCSRDRIDEMSMQRLYMCLLLHPLALDDSTVQQGRSYVVSGGCPGTHAETKTQC